MLACNWFGCPGSTFGLVSSTCNVNGQWRTGLRCELVVEETTYTLEQALVKPVTD